MHEVGHGVLDALLRPLLAALLTALVYAALRVGRHLQDRAPYYGKVRMVYPTGLKLLGILAGLGLPGIFVMAGHQAWQEGTLRQSGFLISCGVVMGLFGLAMMAELAWTEVVADEAGLRARTLWGGSRSFRWEDLSGMAWNSSMSWLVLRDGRGRGIRVSGLMLGLVDFAGLLLRRAPTAALADEELTGRLAVAAEGDTEWMNPLRGH